MATYQPITTAELDANSPITESLMTRLRDNPLALASLTPTATLTGSGTYNVSSDIDLLMICCVGGGGGGGGGGDTGSSTNKQDGQTGGGGGAGGEVELGFITSPSASYSYTCGSGGSGGTNGSNGNDGTDGVNGTNSTFGSIIVYGGRAGKGGLHKTDTAAIAYLPGGKGGRGRYGFSSSGGNAGGYINLRANTTTNIYVIEEAQDGNGSAMGGTGGFALSSNTDTTVGTAGGGGGAGGVPFFLNTTQFGNGGAGGSPGGSGGNATNYGAGGGGGGANGNGGDGSDGIIFVFELQT